MYLTQDIELTIQEGAIEETQAAAGGGPIQAELLYAQHWYQPVKMKWKNL